MTFTPQDIVILSCIIGIVLIVTILGIVAIIKTLINKPERTAPAMVLFSGVAGALTAFVLFFVMTFSGLAAIAMLTALFILWRYV